MEKCRRVRAACDSQPMIAFHACTFHQRWQPMQGAFKILTRISRVGMFPEFGTMSRSSSGGPVDCRRMPGCNVPLRLEVPIFLRRSLSKGCQSYDIPTHNHVPRSTNSLFKQQSNYSRTNIQKVFCCRHLKTVLCIHTF